MNRPVTQTDKPLAGKCIVLTRAPEQSAALAEALERYGAEVLFLPTIAFAPAKYQLLLDAAIKELDQFDWILFTSQNAVRFFSQRRRELGSASGSGKNPSMRVAAIGPATAQAAEKEMWHVDYVAKNHTGASLVSELQSSLTGRKILLPRSDRADPRLLEQLRNIGAHATDVVAYSTVAAETLDSEVLRCLRAGEVDAAVFASPSAFHNLRTRLGSPEVTALSSRTQFAAIGPTTAQALRDAGAQVAIEVSELSTVGAAGLADKIAEYYRQHSDHSDAARSDADRSDATPARRS
jgi:uroporphyrinogen-III synthase